MSHILILFNCFDYYWCYFKLTMKLGPFWCQKLGPKYGFQLIWTLTHLAFVSEFTLTPNFYIDGSTSNCTDWATGCNKIFLVFPSKAIEGGGLGSGVKNHEDLIWLWKWPFLSICQIKDVISWNWSKIEITGHHYQFPGPEIGPDLNHMLLHNCI